LEKEIMVSVEYPISVKRFTSSGELYSYAGLTPTIRHSGSSVRGKAWIRKG